MRLPILGHNAIIQRGMMAPIFPLNIDVRKKKTAPLGTIFVSSIATGRNNGTNWLDAYTDLQTAINSARVGQEIWVRKGTYYPSVVVGGDGSARDKAFYLRTGVAVYGGFSGDDYLWQNRNYIVNETICHAGGNYHVFNQELLACNRTAVLDGFTIRGANGNNTSYGRHRGGGFYLEQYGRSPTIRNCKVTALYSMQGAAAYIYTTSAPLFENCLFFDLNTTDDMVLLSYLQAPSASLKATFLNCQFYNTVTKNQYCIKSSGSGSSAEGINIIGCTFYNFGNYSAIQLLREVALYQDNIIDRCLFYNCYKALELTRLSASVGTTKVSNCLIRNCTFGIVGTSYPSTYWNCTLTGNEYALYNHNTTNTGVIENCIIYGNTNMFARAGYNNFTFTYSDCQTAQSGTGNISINPNWDANYRLNAGSPCVDVGDNTKVYGDYDLDGNARIVNTTVDMGCYERQ